MRILIGGGPRTGKSTAAKKLSEQHNISVRCTDDIIEKFTWSGASLEVATWFDDPGPWIIEGTIVVRALRKWIQQTPAIHAKPADLLLWGGVPFVPLVDRQITMLAGSDTIWSEIRNEVRARGVDVQPIKRTS